MNACRLPAIHDAAGAGAAGGEAAQYRVTIDVSVSSPQALWAAAAARGLAALGATIGDVIATIGPREDPVERDCLAMLMVPPAIAGCAIEDFAITALPGAVMGARADDGAGVPASWQTTRIASS